MYRLATVLAYTASFSAAADDICRVMLFSSGDQTAAYQAGVVKAFAAGPKYQYAATTGVSGGAVSAAILASYPDGQEAEAAQRMIDFWTRASNSPLYKDWLGGVAEGLLLKGGLYNNKLLNEFIDAELADMSSATMQKFVNVGLADVLSGKWTDFTDANLASNLTDVIKGSFAYAGYFPPYEGMGTEWFSGSSIWDLDPFTAVNKCLETHAPEKIEAYVVLTSERHLKQVDPSNYNTIDMVWRFLHVSRYYSQNDSLLRAQFAYPDVNFCVIMPTQDLEDGWLPLNFDEDAVKKMVDQGVADGEAALGSTGCTEVTKMHMQWYQLKKFRDPRVKGLKFDQFKEKKAAGEFEEFKTRRPRLSMKAKDAKSFLQ